MGIVRTASRQCCGIVSRAHGPASVRGAAAGNSGCTADGRGPGRADAAVRRARPDMGVRRDRATEPASQHRADKLQSEHQRDDLPEWPGRGSRYADHHPRASHLDHHIDHQPARRPAEHQRCRRLDLRLGRDDGHPRRRRGRDLQPARSPISAVQSSGKIDIFGTASTPSGVTPFVRDLMVAQLNSNGTVDTTFGNGGVAAHPLWHEPFADLAGLSWPGDRARRQDRHRGGGLLTTTSPSGNECSPSPG